MTGNPYATSSLLDVTKITQNSNAPYYYSPSANIVYVTQAGAVLSGINFGDATVIIDECHVKGLHVHRHDQFCDRGSKRRFQRRHSGELYFHRQ